MDVLDILRWLLESLYNFGSLCPLDRDFDYVSSDETKGWVEAKACAATTTHSIFVQTPRVMFEPSHPFSRVGSVLMLENKCTPFSTCYGLRRKSPRHRRIAMNNLEREMSYFLRGRISRRNL